MTSISLNMIREDNISGRLKVRIGALNQIFFSISVPAYFRDQSLVSINQGLITTRLIIINVPTFTN